MPRLHDLACVVHLHSTYSDGTGTVAQIARAAARAGVDVVLLTDHDTLAAKRNGEERWYDDVLVLVGVEVTPPDHDHFLAFDIDEEVSPRLSGPEICAEVKRRGGFGFGAHPFSRGSQRFRRARGYPFRELDCLDGIELWSFLNDTGEKLTGFRDVLKMILAPQRIIGGPLERNLREWDRMCATRRVVAIGGLDAHQFGIRIAGRVPIRLMGYARSFRQLHTHVLAREPLTREVAHDRALVYEALREGRCYIAVDELAPATGFAFWAEAPGAGAAPAADPARGANAAPGADAAGAALAMGGERVFEPGWTLRAQLPQPADIRVIRDGEVVDRRRADDLHHPIERPGVHRLEVDLAGRAWIVSNPIYLREPAA